MDQFTTRATVLHPFALLKLKYLGYRMPEQWYRKYANGGPARGPVSSLDGYKKHGKPKGRSPVSYWCWDDSRIDHVCIKKRVRVVAPRIGQGTLRLVSFYQILGYVVLLRNLRYVDIIFSQNLNGQLEASIARLRESTKYVSTRVNVTTSLGAKERSDTV